MSLFLKTGCKLAMYGSVIVNYQIRTAHFYMYIQNNNFVMMEAEYLAGTMSVFLMLLVN